MLGYIVLNIVSYLLYHEFSVLFLQINKNSCDNLHSYPFATFSKHCYTNLDFKSTTEEIITRHGFKSVSYSVITDDGYILTVFRIPPKHNSTHNTPVFLQHGISADSTTWVDVGNRSLAFRLAEQGYDVWLGNIRGTRYSNRHMTILPKDKTYWDFNLDTMALNDIRASLKTVAKESGRRGEIIYIGYSQGTTLMFMYASEYPEEAQGLLRGIVAMSPVVYFDPSYFLKFLLKVTAIFGKVLGTFGVNVINPHPDSTQNYYQKFCKLMPKVCKLLIQLEYGHTYQMKDEDLLMFYAGYPTATPVQVIRHYDQIYHTNKLQKYDYGKRGNHRIYSQAKPPLYDLSKIEVPVTLYYGRSDAFISERTTERIFNELGGTHNYIHCVPQVSTRKEDQFNHMDFIFAANITQLFYEDLFQRLYDITKGN